MIELAWGPILNFDDIFLFRMLAEISYEVKSQAWRRKALSHVDRGGQANKIIVMCVSLSIVFLKCTWVKLDPGFCL